MNISVSRAISKSEDVISSKSPRSIIILTLSFLKREIRTFNSFVKTRGARESPKQRQQNSYRRPSHWSLTYVLDFTDRGIAKYASFRSILHILSPGNNISFNRNNPSILKCRYGKFLFRSFRLTTGQFPPSFFFTRNKELRNWSYLGSETTIAPFLNMSWTS